MYECKYTIPYMSCQVHLQRDLGLLQTRHCEPPQAARQSPRSEKEISGPVSAPKATNQES
jgi:hypothetical protein